MAKAREQLSFLYFIASVCPKISEEKEILSEEASINHRSFKLKQPKGKEEVLPALKEESTGSTYLIKANF